MLVAEMHSLQRFTRTALEEEACLSDEDEERRGVLSESSRSSMSIGRPHAVVEKAPLLEEGTLATGVARERAEARFGRAAEGAAAGADASMDIE
mmetsp:Transcript_47326/g.94387  ORF Transcript_47326/g.94387 Transcript_47326/m.94387 type:complete len:94 (-) Transcript_47326:50-331(-)